MDVGTLSIQNLRTLLSYEPKTGVFTWRVRRGGSAPAGSIAGSIDYRGYRYIGINGRYYRAHRLAWFYSHGVWPVDQIDHRNGFKDDNRLENLREATPLLNTQNQRVPQSNNTSGFLGVSWNARLGKWMARIGSNGVYSYLGAFTNPKEAHEAYVAAKRELHKFCTI
jgi:hypothetical protein